jgi:hypothetical protein
MKIIRSWKSLQYFSPNELLFINNPRPSESDKIKFVWRYEGLNILLWALGYKNSLPEPNVICNVKEDLAIIKLNHNPLLLSKNSKLRSIYEILDMADYYRNSGMKK